MHCVLHVHHLTNLSIARHYRWLLILWSFLQHLMSVVCLSLFINFGKVNSKSSKQQYKLVRFYRADYPRLDSSHDYRVMTWVTCHICDLTCDRGLQWFHSTWLWRLLTRVEFFCVYTVSHCCVDNRYVCCWPTIGDTVTVSQICIYFSRNNAS